MEGAGQALSAARKGRTLDTKDVSEQNAREWAEKDERYVWHAMSRYTPVEGGGAAPAPRMVVEEGSGAWI